MKSIITINQLKYFSIAILLAYIFLIIFNNTLYGINDDKYFKFLAQNNTWIGLENLKYNNSGRFFPLHGLFNYLIYNISPQDSVIINNIFFALIFILCCTLIYKTIPKSVYHGFYLWLILLIFSQPLVSIFFQLVQEEKFILFYFILFYFILLKRKENFLSGALLFILGNLIIYSKEPGIAFVFAIGFGLVYFQYITTNRNKFYYYTGILLVVSALISITLYFIIVYPRIIPELIYGKNTDKYVIYFIVNFLKWIINEPVIFIIFIPFLTIKIYKIFIRKTQIVSLHEIMCIGSIGYLTTFFLTKTSHSDYYLSPMYGIIIPYLAQFFNKEKIHNRFNKEKILTLVIVLQILNIELGLSLIPFIRYNNKNLHSVIKITSNDNTNQLRFFSVNDNWRDDYTQHVVLAIQFYQNKNQNFVSTIDKNMILNTTSKNEMINKDKILIIETPWNKISNENMIYIEKIREFKTYEWEANRNFNFIISSLLSRIRNESEQQQNNRMYVRTPNYSLYRLKPEAEYKTFH